MIHKDKKIDFQNYGESPRARFKRIKDKKAAPVATS